MNDPVYQHLREIAWRRKLSEAEEVELREWLAAHPDAAAECEIEFALSEALGRLPDAPVPTNFTARVLQGVEREVMHPAPRRRDWVWIFHVLLPRAALSMLIVGVGVFGYQRHRVKVERVAVKDSLVTIATVPSLPSLEVLQNFDVIQKLDTESAADQELLALMK
jgi:anti-sigma factor RsiW